MSITTALVRPRFVRAAVIALGLFGAASASAAVFVSVNFAPPLLPVYTQPLCPGPGYIWAPGYWAYGPYGYYWVPGTWVLAPFIGALWTPGYWGWSGVAYIWHAGYWGEHVGFYGGIDYGYGYTGVGYAGGRWQNGTFYYNSAVSHVDPAQVRFTYSGPAARNFNVSHVSFNGGRGGITAQPTAEDRLAAREAHRGATPLQTRQQQMASNDRELRASVNHGSPAVAATPRPTEFNRGSAEARGATPERAQAAMRGPSPNEGFERRAAPNAPRTAAQANAAAARNRGTPRTPEMRAQTEPRMQAPTRPEAHAQAPRMQAAPKPQMRAEAPPMQSQPRPETRAQAPRMQATRPEMHAQAPRMEAPRPQMHAQAPHPQAGSRPEAHAQAQGREGNHEERRGG